jgi:hypothetical protein
VNFDALLKDWQNVASSVGSRLGVKWPILEDSGEAEIEKHLKIQLRHHVSSPEQLATRAEVIDWVKETYSLLVRLTVTPDHKASLTQLDRIRDEFERASRAFGTALVEGEMVLASREIELQNVASSRDALKDDQRRLSDVAESVAAKLREELESALAMHSTERQKAAGLADQLRHLEESRRTAAGEIQQLASERKTLQRQVSDLLHEQQRQQQNAAAAAAAATEALESAIAALESERRKSEQQGIQLAATATAVAAMRCDRDETARKYHETAAALEALRNEKRAGDGACVDLEGKLSQSLQDQGALTQMVERISEELRRMQDRPFDRNSGGARELEAEIRTLRSQVILVRSGLLDVEWYCAGYPDVPQSEFDVAEHYLRIGVCEGYKPNPLFDTNWYLQRYEDVREAGINPLLHYLQHGFREGRDPGPDFETEFYLETNPDVRAAGINPLAHYLRHGRRELRLPSRPPCDAATTAVVQDMEPGLKFAAVEGRSDFRR